MAFNVGAFVGGMFDGFKSGQDLIKARNDLIVQGLNIDAAQSAQKNIEAGKEPVPGVDFPYPGVSATGTPGEGSAPKGGEGSGSSEWDRAAAGIGNGEGAVIPKSEHVDLARYWARYHGVPEDMFAYQIGGESGYKPNISNNIGLGHYGIAQFDPPTAKQYGVDVNDVNSSLNGAAHYMADLYKKTGSWDGAMRAYLGATTPEGLQRALANNPSYQRAYSLARAGGAPAVTPGPGDTPEATPAPIPSAPVDTGASGDIDAQAGGGTKVAAAPARPDVVAPASGTSALGNRPTFTDLDNPQMVYPNAGDPVAPTRALGPGAAAASAAPGSEFPPFVPPPGVKAVPGEPGAYQTPPRTTPPVASTPGGRRGIAPPMLPGQNTVRAPVKTSALLGGGSNLFPAARRAPDGRDYVPDPNRPGKYLMVNYG